MTIRDMSNEELEQWDGVVQRTIGDGALDAILSADRYIEEPRMSLSSDAYQRRWAVLRNRIRGEAGVCDRVVGRILAVEQGRLHESPLDDLPVASGEGGADQ